jgi:hypothetical protein
MKTAVLSCLVFLIGATSPLPAGSILRLSDRPEDKGKLTLTPASIQIETGAAPDQVDLTDILEANFGEAPFQLEFFSGDRAGQTLPPDWKVQDLGPAVLPGTATLASGTLTLNGGGVTPADNNSFAPQNIMIKQLVFGHPIGARDADNVFFAGQPWTGDGEWTARLSSIAEKDWQTTAGLMLRDSLDPGAMMFGLVGTGHGGGGAELRAETGSQAVQEAVPMDLPIWFRLTRAGASVSASISTDAKEWDLIAQSILKIGANPWIGLFVNAHNQRVAGNAVFDQISFTPAPSQAQIFPPGVLLQDGTFLAGNFRSLPLDPAQPDAAENFTRNGMTVSIPRSKIAVVLMLPTARSQVAAMNSSVGLLMKNGDVLNEAPDVISASGVRVSSVLLGVTTYNPVDVRACFLEPLQTPTAHYEIRLRDRSVIYADSVEAHNDSLLLQDTSGVAVEVTRDEIAQFRAGPAVAQPLAELDWKAVSPATPQAPIPAAPPQTNAPSSTAGAAPAALEASPPVWSWQGPNEEELIEATAGTTLNFPLSERITALSSRIVLSPDSPPNVSVTVRVLADGREIGRTPPLKAGDPPRLMKASVQNPKAVSFEVDSTTAESKLIFIDPVAIRPQSP